MENGTASEAASEQAAGKPVLAWLQIHALPERNVEPCRLRFGEGFNVLLGLNATGKTTLLEIIVAAMSFNFSKFAEEPFDIEYELRTPGAAFYARVRNEKTSPEPLPALVGLRGGESLRHSVELRVTLVSPKYEWRVEANGDALEVTGADGQTMRTPFPSASILRPGFLRHAVALMLGTCSIKPFPIKVFAAPMLSWSDLVRFDEALGFFDLITSEGVWIEVWRSRAEPYHVAFEDHHFAPGSLCDEVARQCERRPFEDGGSFSVSPQSAKFLAQASAFLDFKAIRAEMRIQQRRAVDHLDRLRFGDLRFTFERHDGSLITHNELSYGQKRLLSLLYYLEMLPDAVIADELVDGLHNRWIDAAIEAIGDRQAFLASQNPLILDHLEFSSAEEVASTFVVCRIERRDEGEHLVWANMSDVDAERFFRAYEVGIQQVSEILLTKGLW